MPSSLRKWWHGDWAAGDRVAGRGAWRQRDVLSALTLLVFTISVFTITD